MPASRSSRGARLLQPMIEVEFDRRRRRHHRPGRSGDRPPVGRSGQCRRRPRAESAYGMGGNPGDGHRRQCRPRLYRSRLFPRRPPQARQEAAPKRPSRSRSPSRLGLSTIEAAAGIYDVINSKMSDLIRRQVVRAGHVPEEYVMYAFGGAGPVHAAGLRGRSGHRRDLHLPDEPGLLGLRRGRRRTSCTPRC